MTFLRIPLVLFLLVALAACSDDSPTSNDDGGNNNNNNSSFKDEVTATINGDAWTASNFVATYNSASSITAVTLNGFGPNNSQISFGIAFASATTHTIEDGSGVQATFDYEGVRYGTGETGTINITSLSSSGMKGTFTINAKSDGGKEGTATGSFDVSFP